MDTLDTYRATIERILTERAEIPRAGVPKDHIVLAFHEPALRKYTEYAVE